MNEELTPVSTPETDPPPVPVARSVSPPAPAAPSPTPVVADPMPWTVALLISFFMPIRVLRNGWHKQGILSALAVHIIGLSVAAIGLTLIDLTFSDSYFLYAFSGYGYGMLDFIYDVLGMILFTEFMYLIAALAFMGWAARCETWGRSFVRSLSRWYQLTPWHVAMSLVLVLIFLGFEDLRYVDYGNYSSYSYETGLSREMEAITYLFQAAFGLAYFGLVGWRTLVALGVHRPQPGWAATCVWPANCEGCGYSLAGLDQDRDCPECGKPARESKYTPRTASPMPPLAAMWAAVTAPRRFGQSMAVHQPVQGHGWAYFYSVCSFAVIGLVGVFFTMIVMAVIGEADFSDIDLEALVYMLFAGTLAGLYVMSLGIMVIQAAVFLVGLGQGLFGHRHRFHTAQQAAGYASGLVVPWAVFTWIGGTIWFVAMIHSVGAAFGGGPTNPVWEILVVAVPLLLLAVGLGMFIYYLVLINRIVSGTRHANT